MPVITIPFDADPRRKRIVRLEPTVPLRHLELNVDDWPTLPPAKILDAIINDSTNSSDKWKILPYNSESHFPLGRLPLELREMVYEEAMRASGNLGYPLFLRDFVWSSSHSTYPTFLPAICCTSTAILKEAAPVFLRTQKFFYISSFESNILLTKFLESLPDNTGFRSVKEIHFGYFDCFPGGSGLKNMDIELASRCTALHTVELTFHVKQLRKCIRYDYDGYDSYYEAKTVEELVAYYRFQDIFECKKLKKIVWIGRAHFGIEDETAGDLRETLSDLADWLKKGFAERNQGQVVDMNIIWR